MKDVTLQSASLTIAISPLGAELQSVRDANGVERIWQGDGIHWNKHAPVLFPVAGALKDNAYRLGEKRFTLSKHGFARERLFDVEAVDAASATLVLRGEPARDPGFPFAYEFRVRFSLDGDTLRTEYIVNNHDAQPFWCGVGAHEAYACPEGIEAYEIAFDVPETVEHSVLDGGLLTGETRIVRQNCDALPITPELFANDTLVLRSLRTRAVTLRSPLHNRRTRIEFDDFDNLLIWTQLGAAYVCIEPWTNVPDFIGSDQDITQKPGMLRLDAGECRSTLHKIRFF